MDPNLNQNQPIPVEPPAPPKPNPASNTLIVLLVALSFILFASTGFLAYQNYQLRMQAKTSVSYGLPSPSPSASSDPTTNWTTYTTSNDYLFKYPADYFKYQEETIPGYVYLAPSKGNGGNGIKFLEKTDLWLETSDQTPMDFDPATVTTPVMIGGLTGKKLTLSSPMVAGNVTKYSFVAWVNANGKLYSASISSWDEASLKNSEKLFDQILSTFKFTN